MARHLTAALLCALMLFATAAATERVALDGRDWHDVRSENFRILGVLGEQRSVELLRHLEIMRATLGDAAEESTWRSAVPTVIVAVDDHDDYVSIGAPENSSGFFFADLRENAILVADTDDASGIQVLLHEFAHYLSKQTGRIRYPRWFEEGNAEYVSYSRIGNDSFEFGIAPDEYLAALHFARWMPFSHILAIQDAFALDATEGSLFYAQSWLLVHYLRSLPDADLDLPIRLAEYARLVSDGAAPVDAFEKSFGLDADRLDDDLLRYYTNGEFPKRSVPADTALPGFSARITRMSAPEARLVLARMALRFDQFDTAEAWFVNVLDDDELRAHAEAGLGRIAGMRGDVEAANRRFEAAIYLMSWDFTIWMDYAQYWAQRVSASVDASERDRHASRLIESLENALTISEATPELNSLMGFAYLAKGRSTSEAIAYLEAAADEAPHDQASRLLLANAYLYVGRLQDAVDQAESILQFEHDPGLITEAANEVIAEARQRGAR